ncbi:MAG: MFS transporter [Candidatus Aenigmatarchaeota archaeon]
MEPTEQQLRANIWKFYLAEFFSNFWFIAVIYILYMQYFGVSYTGIGTLEFVCLMVAVLLEIPTGAFADMFGRRNSVCIGMAVLVVASLIVGLSSVFLFFIIGFFFWGVADAFITGAREALIYETLKALGREKEYLKIQSRLILISTMAIVIAAFTGSILFSINVRLAYFALAGSMAIAAIIMLSVKEPPMKKIKFNITAHYDQVKKGVGYLLSSKYLKWLVGFSAIMFAPYYVFDSLMNQPYLIGSGFKVVELGLIFAIVYGISGFMTAFIHHAERFLKEKLSLLLVVLVHGTTFLLMALLSTPLIVMVFILFYLGHNYRYIVVDAYMQKHTPSNIRATLTSSHSMLMNASGAIAVVIGGMLIDATSLNTTLIVLTAFTFVVGLLWLGKRYL